MKSALHETIKFIAVLLALTISIVNGAYGSAQSREPVSATDLSPAGSSTPTIGLSLGFAMADFTGDTHPDLATVELNGFDSASALYVIDVRLSEGGRQFLRVTAPCGGLLVTPRDVTGDGNLDLVIRAATTGALVTVFLNDGSGHFTAVEPSAFTNILRETTSERKLATERFCFSATLVSPRTNTIRCQIESTRNPQERSASYFFATRDVPLHRFVPFNLDRAPPTIA